MYGEFQLGEVCVIAYYAELCHVGLGTGSCSRTGKTNAAVCDSPCQPWPRGCGMDGRGAAAAQLSQTEDQPVMLSDRHHVSQRRQGSRLDRKPTYGSRVWRVANGAFVHRTAVMKDLYWGHISLSSH